MPPFRRHSCMKRSLLHQAHSKFTTCLEEHMKRCWVASPSALDRHASEKFYLSYD
ncbi:hypothetical protein H6H02_14705 [Coleofasciculus sp. FACHB-1120]|nr:hypothetical protein [Coleofasciculus sp. FACHB-1120]